MRFAIIWRRTVRKEALGAGSNDLGHGDGRGQYVRLVIAGEIEPQRARRQGLTPVQFIIPACSQVYIG